MKKMATLTALVWVAASGCGDDGEKAGASYAPLNAAGRSDGSPAGDLVALQYRQSEIFCACIGDPDLSQWCVDVTWPQERIDCMRSAYAEELSTDTGGLACFEQALRRMIDCQLSAGCADDADFRACTETFEEDVKACPRATGTLQASALDCFELAEGF